MSTSKQPQQKHQQATTQNVNNKNNNTINWDQAGGRVERIPGRLVRVAVVLEVLLLLLLLSVMEVVVWR